MSEAALAKASFKPTVLWVPFGLLVLVYLPTLYELVQDWYLDDNYSHGFLIPVVSVYLLWSARKELAEHTVSQSTAGLALVAAGLALFVLGSAAAEFFTTRFSFVVTLFGLSWYLFGTERIKRTWFAFFFLCFMIPIPYVIYFSIAFPMQLIASKITVGALNILGMEVVRQGNIIHLAGGCSLEVVDACSGIRSLIALLALGTLYAHFTQKGWPRQVLLFLATIPIAVVANVFRVFVTTLLASAVGLDVAEEPTHTLMGMSVFVVSFTCLFLFGWILKRFAR
ncbi:MAG: exosortase [Candidatus Zixiibacteriota bacterium]|nr:MAG: exosortase [candidate division Zixibacteria bacterium]